MMFYSDQNVKYDIYIVSSFLKLFILQNLLYICLVNG